MADDKTYKIMVIGNTRVGKTMLLFRFCQGKEFSAEFQPTVGIDFLEKTLTRYVYVAIKSDSI